MEDNFNVAASIREALLTPDHITEGRDKSPHSGSRLAKSTAYVILTIFKF